MRCGVVFSPAGAQALSAVGRADLVVARGHPALSEARALGLNAVGIDALLEGDRIEDIDGPAIAAGRSWRPGPISLSMPWLELGLLAEYEVWNIAARILRLAAALQATPSRATLVVATRRRSPEALVAEAVARARNLELEVIELRPEPRSPWDITALASRPASFGRRAAKYWLARLGTLGFSGGEPVAAYVWGEAGPLVFGLARRGVIRPVLDPTEPPPRHAYLGGSLRHAAWAGGRVRRQAGIGSSRLPTGPALEWRGVDLAAPVAAALHAVVTPQLAAWEVYARDLLKSWARARVRAVVLSNDCTAAGRIRALVAERLGAASVVVQHGVLEWIADRNHEVADYSAVWGSLAARDLVDRGIDASRLQEVGWPAGSGRLAEAKRRRSAAVREFALLLTTTLAAFTAAVPEDSVETQLTSAVGAVRRAGWRGEIVVKIHPGQSEIQFRQLLVRAGYADVKVAGGRADTWALMADARFAITVSSSVACALPHLECPCLVYEHVRQPYGPYLARFREFAATSDESEAERAATLLIRGHTLSGSQAADSVFDYAPAPHDSVDRFAALLARAVRSGPVGAGAMGRALDVDRHQPAAFDRLPLATHASIIAAESSDRL